MAKFIITRTANETKNFECILPDEMLSKFNEMKGFDNITDFKDYICNSIKMQNRDGKIRTFIHSKCGDLGIINLDLYSKKSPNKNMYGIAILNVYNNHSWKLGAFLTCDMIEEIFQIQPDQLPHSSRNSEDFRSQLAKPSVADLIENEDYECKEDYPCVATVAFDANDRYYIKWIQICYYKSKYIYRGVGFRYLNINALVYGYIHQHGCARIITPDDVMGVITKYCTGLVIRVCDTEIDVDVIRKGNQLLGSQLLDTGLSVSAETLNKYRSLSNDELGLNDDGTFGFVLPPDWDK